MKTSKIIILVAALGIPLAGCTILGLSSGDSMQERLDEAQDAWEARHISSYTFNYRMNCFCAGAQDSVRVVVRAGTIESLTYITTNTPVEEGLQQLFKTIPALFEVIDDAIDRKADSIDVTYDATYHFPSHAYIDYSRQTADEEFGFTVSAFQIN